MQRVKILIKNMVGDSIRAKMNFFVSLVFLLLVSGAFLHEVWRLSQEEAAFDQARHGHGLEVWYRGVPFHLILAAIAVFCMILLYISLIAFVRTNRSLIHQGAKLSEANEKLQKEQELFRTVYEQAPVGISVYIGGIANYNSMYEKIAGLPAEEIRRQGWRGVTHPDDIEAEHELCTRFLYDKTSIYKMNKRYVKPDGSVIWANLTAAPLQVSSDSELDFMCIIEDITEKVTAEAELRKSERNNEVLLSNLPGMAYRCKYDHEWTMQFVSEGCLELTGYPSAHLLDNSGICFNDLILPKYQNYLWDRWIKVIDSKSKLMEEYEIITASGEVKWVYEQGQAIYDEAGNVDSLEGLLVDITDRKKKEEEVLYLNYHDHLTGIYNRRYFEMEKERIDRNIFLPISVIVGDINGVKLVNDAFGHAAGDVLIEATAKMIQGCCSEDDIAARTGGDEFQILMPFTSREEAGRMVERIKSACENYNATLPGEGYSINLSLGFSTKELGETSLEAAIKQAEDYMYKRKLLEHRSSHSVILSSIKATLHEKSHETMEHAERLTCLAQDMGRKLKLSQQELDDLVLVSTLHDIGKVGIDDRILNKADRLNEEEWETMKKHSEIGYRIAMSSPDLVQIADCILSLHEHWDGTGYPQGIIGNQIPRLSRIVSIVDAFDAMTEDRAYRGAMTREEAACEIRKRAGTVFDPNLARIFLEKVLPYADMENQSGAVSEPMTGEES